MVAGCAVAIVRSLNSLSWDLAILQRNVVRSGLIDVEQLFRASPRPLKRLCSKP